MSYVVSTLHYNKFTLGPTAYAILNLQNEVASFKSSRQKWSCPSYASDCIEMYWPQLFTKLMENLPFEPCEKPKSSHAFARHLNFHYVSQNPFSFVFPTSFVTPSLKHIHVFF
jgi:hypothetical protein